MIELVKYFRILFLSVRLSRDRFKNFCEDHIVRLSENNPGGIFTTILTSITAAYNAYYGDLSSEEVNEAVKQGKTIALKESRTALEKQINDNEKLVAYTYRNDAEAYEEFYPEGLTEYYNATQSTLETISDRYKTVLANHAADFPAQFVTDYNAVQQTYVDNRTAQTVAISHVEAERSDMATTRPAVALQLTKNLLTISLQYVGDESKAALYFNQQILDDAFRASERRVEAEIDPGVSHNVFDNITQADVRLVVKNNGTTDLFVGFRPLPTDTVDGTSGKQLKPGEEDSGLAGEGGWRTTNKYFNITNPDGGNAGSYIAQKI